MCAYKNLNIINYTKTYLAHLDVFFQRHTLVQKVTYLYRRYNAYNKNDFNIHYYYLSMWKNVIIGIILCSILVEILFPEKKTPILT